MMLTKTNRGPAERGRLPTGGAAALMFASTPEKQQAAWKFMKFITDATGATIMVKGSGCMPPNSRPTEDPALLKAFYETHPNHMTALRQAPYMTAWYAFPGGEAFQFGDNFINDRITDLRQFETGAPPRSCQ
jgi:ABC-type glycerol-3-phosphate transport system substrate-binding protein